MLHCSGKELVLPTAVIYIEFIIAVSGTINPTLLVAPGSLYFQQNRVPPQMGAPDAGTVEFWGGPQAIVETENRSMPADGVGGMRGMLIPFISEVGSRRQCRYHDHGLGYQLRAESERKIQTENKSSCCKEDIWGF